jgi:hypothetical protein
MHLALDSVVRGLSSHSEEIIQNKDRTGCTDVCDSVNLLCFFSLSLFFKALLLKCFFSVL